MDLSTPFKNPFSFYAFVTNPCSYKRVFLNSNAGRFVPFTVVNNKFLGSRNQTSIFEHFNSGFFIVSITENDVFMQATKYDCGSFCPECAFFNNLNGKHCNDCCSFAMGKRMTVNANCNDNCIFRIVRDSFVKDLTRECIESNPGPSCCGFNFDSESAFSSHVEKCSALKQDMKEKLSNPSCYFCKNDFKTLTMLNQHIMNKHKNVCWICSIEEADHKCKLEGASLRVLAAHEKKEIAKVTRPTKKPRDNVKCKYCNKEVKHFMSPEDWKAHEKDCIPPTKCDHCKYVSRNKDNLDLHKIVAHKDKEKLVEHKTTVAEAHKNPVQNDAKPTKPKGEIVSPPVPQENPWKNLPKVEQDVLDDLFGTENMIKAEEEMKSDEKDKQSKPKFSGSFEETVVLPADEPNELPEIDRLDEVFDVHRLINLRKEIKSIHSDAVEKMYARGRELVLYKKSEEPVNTPEPEKPKKTEFESFSHPNPNVDKDCLTRKLFAGIVNVAVSLFGFKMDKQLGKILDTINNTISPYIFQKQEKILTMSPFTTYVAQPTFTFYKPVMTGLFLLGMYNLSRWALSLGRDLYKIKKMVGVSQSLRIALQPHKVHWVAKEFLECEDDRHDAQSSRDVKHQAQLRHYEVYSYTKGGMVGESTVAKEGWHRTDMVISEELATESMSMRNFTDLPVLGNVKTRIDQFIMNCSIIGIDRKIYKEVYVDTAAFVYGKYLSMVKTKQARLGFLPPQ